MIIVADVKWIKIVTDIFDDEKILLIESLPDADSIIVVWFKLLTLAGKQNNNGVFLMSNRIPYTDEMLAAIFRRNINTVRLALKTFEQFGMIEIVDNVITIPNWNKHQTLDAYEKKKKRDRLYQQERRAAQKALVAEKSSDTSPDVAVSDKEEDKDIEGDRDIDIDGVTIVPPIKPPVEKPPNFIPPTVEEVAAYCRERKNKVDPNRFVDFYSMKGWMVGKSKMKDWKAAVRTWEHNSKTGKPATAPQRDYDSGDQLPW